MQFTFDVPDNLIQRYQQRMGERGALGVHIVPMTVTRARTLVVETMLGHIRQVNRAKAFLDGGAQYDTDERDLAVFRG